ncbi:unnamed protein product [Phytophthora fragariaefolia]|uniref:Unnamed protein product n=1 Tax=Phytophthora fragariaefolia TaxID=1490495 RepID=A0A9W7D781_9STRA|nr:unnamed protein product [Phytophthora fragariaefolia]
MVGSGYTHRPEGHQISSYRTPSWLRSAFVALLVTRSTISTVKALFGPVAGRVRGADKICEAASCHSDEEGKSDAEMDEHADLSEDEVEDEQGQDKVPVAFDLTEGDLDRLQADEWDVFKESSSGQVLLDPIPLYDGPSGPTRAVMAYASNPFAIFYFILPKEL